MGQDYARRLEIAREIGREASARRGALTHTGPEEELTCRFDDFEQRDNFNLENNYYKIRIILRPSQDHSERYAEPLQRFEQPSYKCWSAGRRIEKYIKTTVIIEHKENYEYENEYEGDKWTDKVMGYDSIHMDIKELRSFVKAATDLLAEFDLRVSKDEKEERDRWQKERDREKERYSGDFDKYFEEHGEWPAWMPF